MKTKFVHRTLSACFIAATLATLTGCGELLHNLQPHRLQHLNRGPALGGENYNFSVSDPIPEKALEANQDDQSDMDR